MPHLLLLGTSACHLCEQAEEILETCLRTQTITLEYIDIAEQDHWQARYAIRIPVLYHPDTQKELGWPFERVDVLAFIKGL